MDKLKRNAMLCIISFLPCIVFADSQIDALQQRVDRTYITTPNGTCGAYTASARPTLNSCNECCGSNWNIGASLLYWQGKTCGTEYAFGKQNSTIEIDGEPENLPVTLPTKGNIHSVNSKWNWGFKVALGYNFEHDSWESNLCYTSFIGNGSDKTTAGCNDSVMPIVGTYSITSPAKAVFIFCTRAKSQTELHFRTLSWDIARDFFVSDCLSIRPFTALEAAWITTRQSTRYTGGIPPIETLLGLDNDFVRVKENCMFNGLGPVMGLSTNWHIGRGISLFNEFTIGMLYGKFQISHGERYSADILSRIKLKEDCHKFCPMAKYMLGLASKCYFNDDQNYLTVRLGFESQYWWRVNRVIHVIDITDLISVSREGLSLIKPLFQGLDMSIIGVTFDVRLDF